MGAYHFAENFGHSGWKINGKVTFQKFQPKVNESFRGSLFILVGTNQTECCFSWFLLASRLMLHKFAPFLESNHTLMWKFGVNLVNRLPICFWHPNQIILSSGKHPNTQVGWYDNFLNLPTKVKTMLSQYYSNDTLSTMQ